MENPEKVLPLVFQENLLPSLRIIASRGFDREVSQESIQRHTLTNQDYLFLIQGGNALVGFASVKILLDIESCAFLTGIVFLPEHQGRGLGNQIFSQVKKASKCKILGLTTQSPMIYRLLQKISVDIYPDVNGRAVPENVQMLGQKIMQECRKGKPFCSQTFVSKEIYPQCLYTEFPWCRDSQINAFFKRNLHFEGDKTKDGFLLIGTIA